MSSSIRRRLSQAVAPVVRKMLWSEPLGRVYRRPVPTVAEALESRQMYDALYWDPNGAASGVGGSGTWDSTGTVWATNTAGLGAHVAWSNGSTAVFLGPSGAVTLAGDVSAAALQFDSSGYRLTGEKTIALGNGTITAPSGSDPRLSTKMSGDVTIAGTGRVYLTGDIGRDTTSLPSLTVVSAARVSFSADQHLASLTLLEGSRADINTGGTKVLYLGDLSIDVSESSGAKLDLNDNALVLANTASASYIDLSNWVKTGRGGVGTGAATWNGFGIISSSFAQYYDETAGSIGTVDNGDVNVLVPLATLFGHTLEGDRVVRYTRGADFTLDGIVDDTDVALIGLTYDNGLVSGRQWFEADGNFDGAVNDDDVAILGLAYDPNPQEPTFAIDGLDSSTIVGDELVLNPVADTIVPAGWHFRWTAYGAANARGTGTDEQSDFYLALPFAGTVNVVLEVQKTNSTTWLTAATSSFTVRSPSVSTSGSEGALTNYAYELDLSSTNVGSHAIQSWLIDWGDGSDPEEVSGSLEAATHTYTTAGLASIAVVGTSSDGSFAAPVKQIAIRDFAAVDDVIVAQTSPAMFLKVLGNDPTTNGVSSVITGVSGASQGTLYVDSSAPYSIAYIPYYAGYTGTDTFTYTISDGQGGTSTGTVHLTLLPATGALAGDGVLPGQRQYTLSDGFAVNGRDSFTRVAQGNFDYRQHFTSSTTQYSATGSVATTVNQDVGVVSEQDVSGNWSYQEDVTLVTTIVTTWSNGEGHQTEFLTDSYLFVSSGDEARSAYSIDSTTDDDLHGSLTGTQTQSWSLQGDKASHLAKVDDPLAGFVLFANDEHGSDTFTSSGHAPYSYSSGDTTVSGTTGQSAYFDDNYSYWLADLSNTAGTYVEHHSDGWDYAGSGDIPQTVTNESGTLTGVTNGSYTNSSQSHGHITEHGGGSTSGSYTINSSWDSGSVVQNGSSEDIYTSDGDWNSSVTGTYSHTVHGGSLGDSTVTGDTGAVHDVTWDSGTTVRQELEPGGSWIASYGVGTTTGTTKDDWSYSGDGNYTQSVDDNSVYGNDTTVSGTIAAGSPTATYQGHKDLSGTIDEGQTNGSTDTYSIDSHWSDGSWTQHGQNTSHDKERGHWSSAGEGNYNHSVKGGTLGTTTVTGSADATHGVTWGSDGDTTLTLDTTGSWKLSGGDSTYTGITRDNWGYDGDGQYTNTATGTSFDASTVNVLGISIPFPTSTYTTKSDVAGTIHENGRTTSTVSYIINSHWTGSSWAQTGNSSEQDTDDGHWSSGGDGHYTHTANNGSYGNSTVTGTSTTTHTTDWGSDGHTNMTLNPAGTWVMTSGTGTYTGSTQDDWSTGGTGTYKQADHGESTAYQTTTLSATTSGGSPTVITIPTTTYIDDSSFNGSIDEGDEGHSSSSYTIHSNWSNSAWHEDGQSKSDDNTHGHWSASGTGNYTHAVVGGSLGNSNVTGTVTKSHDQTWGSDDHNNMTLNAAGTWVMTSGTGTYTGSTNDDWNSSGHGTYTQLITHTGATTTTVLNDQGDTDPNNDVSELRTLSEFEDIENKNGIIDESDSGHDTTSYSINSNWSSSASKWLENGLSKANDNSHHTWSASGTGNYTHHTFGQASDYSVSGTSSLSQKDVSDSSGHSTQTLKLVPATTTVSTVNGTATTGTIAEHYDWSMSSGDGLDTGLTTNSWKTDGSGTHHTQTVESGSTTGDSPSTFANTKNIHGNVGEGATGTFNSDYTLNSTWSDGASGWTNTGTNKFNSDNHGYLSITGTGDYTNSLSHDNYESSVTGTVDTNYKNNWKDTGNVTSTWSDAATKWVITSGEYHSTGDTTSTWDADGNGTFTDHSTTVGADYKKTDVNGFIDEGVSGTFTDVFNLDSNWMPSVTGSTAHWQITGTDTQHDDTHGYQTVRNFGNYTHAASSADGTLSVSGTSGATHGATWSDVADATQTWWQSPVDSVPSTWVITEAHDVATGESKDTWSYSGGGNYSASGSGINQTVLEKDKSNSEESYSIHSTWTSITPVTTVLENGNTITTTMGWVRDSGLDTGTQHEDGTWTSSGSGNYTHGDVDGTKGVTFAEDWKSDGTVNMTWNASDKSWEIASGTGTASGKSVDNWSYSGGGDYTESSFSGQTDESGTNGLTHSYSVNANWSPITEIQTDPVTQEDTEVLLSYDWKISQSKTDTSLNQGHWSAHAEGAYQHDLGYTDAYAGDTYTGVIDGSTAIDHNKDWSYSSVSTKNRQNIGSVTGTWACATQIQDSSYNQADTTNSSGSGGYTRLMRVHDDHVGPLLGSLTASGSASEANHNTFSLSLTSHADQDGANAPYRSGAGKGVTFSSSTFGYNMSGTGGGQNNEPASDYWDSVTRNYDDTFSDQAHTDDLSSISTSWVYDQDGTWRAAKTTNHSDGHRTGDFTYSAKHSAHEQKIDSGASPQTHVIDYTHNYRKSAAYDNSFQSDVTKTLDADNNATTSGQSSSSQYFVNHWDTALDRTRELVTSPTNEHEWIIENNGTDNDSLSWVGSITFSNASADWNLDKDEKRRWGERHSKQFLRDGVGSTLVQLPISDPEPYDELGKLIEAPLGGGLDFRNVDFVGPGYGILQVQSAYGWQDGVNVGPIGDINVMAGLDKACFVAGTLVLMADGTTRAIEQLKPHDKVLSVHELDPEGKPVVSTVVELYDRGPKPILEVRVAGEVIRCTFNHRFYVRNRGWIGASELLAGDQVRTPQMEWVSVNSITETPDIEPVFNLQVDATHTYFVGLPAKSLGVLVHNDACGEAAEQSKKQIDEIILFHNALYGPQGEYVLRAYLGSGNKIETYHWWVNKKSDVTGYFQRNFKDTIYIEETLSGFEAAKELHDRILEASGHSWNGMKAELQFQLSSGHGKMDPDVYMESYRQGIKYVQDITKLTAELYFSGITLVAGEAGNIEMSIKDATEGHYLTAAIGLIPLMGPLVKKGGSLILRDGTTVIAKIDSETLQYIRNAGCFTAETLVSCESELRPINSIQMGEKVWTFNPATHEWSLQPVLMPLTFDYEGDIITVTSEGAVVEATGSHPFLVVEGQKLQERPVAKDVPAEELAQVRGGRWVEARDLCVGDVLLTQNQGRISITRLSSETRRDRVYNLWVDDVHTYAVGPRRIIVHNNSEECARLIKATVNGLSTREASLARVAAIRSALKISNGKNIAFATFEVSGKAGSVVATSGEYVPSGTISMPLNRVFSTAPKRAFDSEVFIMEHIAQDLSRDATGTIRIFSERKVCNSCEEVIKQFKEMFPNITVLVEHGG